jgi:phenylacetate-CoA ligase
MIEWEIQSQIDGIKWPALPAPNASGRLAALFQLEQSQWWPAEKLREHQFQQLEALLAHSVEHVPYYRELLGAQIRQQPLTDELWRSIPILTRDTLQKIGAQLHTEVMPPNHGKAALERTSGSTGTPIEALSTDVTRFFWSVFTLREHLWHKRDLSGKLAVARFSRDERVLQPHGHRTNNWGFATAGLVKSGECALISVFTPIPELVSWLQKEEPDYFLTHPSVLQGMALYCEKEAIKLPFLREVRTISEALPDSLRELCKRVWDVRLVDIYSTVELGYLAFQCPDYEHYHLQSEGMLVEILDENNSPCAPGEVGRVVVTSLHNYASPLIRYEVGDYAEVGEPCACGRGLPVIKRILGRYRSLLTMPSGEKRWPRIGILQLGKIAPVKQFQAVQKSLTEVECRLVMPRPLRPEESARLQDHFSQKLGDAFNVTIVEVESLQRSASGKYEEFISEL